MAKKSKKNSHITNTNSVNSTNDIVDLNQIGVVITRPKEQSEFLIQAIQKNNGTAFSVPCIEIQDPIDPELARKECTEIADDADYWAFTSPNSVEYALKFGINFSDNKPCISIGSGTTKLLKQLTTAEIIQGEKPYTTEKLLEALQSIDLTNQKVSIFSGEGGRRLLENAMNAQDANAHYVDVYRRVPVQNIDITKAVEYSQNHPLVIFVSSQEAFGAYHQVAIEQDTKAFEHTLIVASERLATFVTQLGYQKVYIAKSAVSTDLWQKLVEVSPELTLSNIDSHLEDSSMTQSNNKDNPEIPEEPVTTVEEINPEPEHKKIEYSEQPTPQKPNHSLSYIALALGIVGIGIGAFAFLQSSQEGTNAQDMQRNLTEQIKQQNTQIESLTQSLASFKKSVDAERGQSSDFTDLADAQKKNQQSVLALQDRLSTLDASLNNLQADNGTSLTRYNQLKDHLNEFEKIVTNLDQSINQIGKTANDVQNDAVKTQNRLTSQLVEINSKIASLTALEARLSASTDLDLLNLSQAKYLLRLANFKLMFENDTSEASKILSEASERLMATANAKFSETNNLIQSEIVKLKNIPTIDHEECAARIQKISELIPSIDTKSDDILGDLKNTFQNEINNKKSATDPEKLSIKSSPYLS